MDGTQHVSTHWVLFCAGYFPQIVLLMFFPNPGGNSGFQKEVICCRHHKSGLVLRSTAPGCLVKVCFHSRQLAPRTLQASVKVSFSSLSAHFSQASPLPCFAKAQFCIANPFQCPPGRLDSESLRTGPGLSHLCLPSTTQGPARRCLGTLAPPMAGSFHVWAHFILKPNQWGSFITPTFERGKLSLRKGSQFLGIFSSCLLKIKIFPEHGRDMIF